MCENKIKESVLRLKDTNDFDELYFFYNNKVNCIAKKFGIEEDSSLLMMKLWQFFKEVDLSKFENDVALLAYINKCLKNWSINIRKKESTKEICSDLIVTAAVEKGYNSTKFEYTNDLEFYSLINRLSNTQKQILCYRYLDQLSDSEIAIKLQISRQAVHKKRKQALFKLKDSI